MVERDENHRNHKNLENHRNHSLFWDQVVDAVVAESKPEQTGEGVVAGAAEPKPEQTGEGVAADMVHEPTQAPPCDSCDS